MKTHQITKEQKIKEYLTEKYNWVSGAPIPNPQKYGLTWPDVYLEPKK